MKKGKKVLAGFLAASLAVSTAVTVQAATEHWNDGSVSAGWSQWKSDWTTIQNDYEKVSLTPGVNESQINFAWYCKTVELPKVRFSTAADMSNAVEYTGRQEKITIEALDGYYSNKVTATDLQENTTYYYQVFKNGAWGETVSYKTGDSKSYSFLYVGDPQIGACKNQTSSEGETMKNEIAARNDSYNWDVVLSNAKAAHPDVSFMVSAGDQVNYADREYEYAGYLNPTVLKSLPVATTIGNHDSGSYQYSYHFNNPNSFAMTDTTYAAGATQAGTDYYFTYGDALFIMIDTNNYNCATHEEVIKKAVSENEDKKWRIVTFHQDIYGSGYDHSDSDGMVLRTQLTPIFDKYDIDVALQGHDHTYSRSYQLSGDGKTHTSYDKNNYQADSDYVNQNNCYVINSDVKTGKVVDPEGTIYMEANSATGSKFYELIAAQQDYIAERSQTWTPSYMVVDMTETTFTIQAYDATTNEVLGGSSAYTIVKKADNTSLVALIAQAEEKLNTAVYTDETKAALKSAIAEAKQVADIVESTSDDIANASAKISNAVAGLVLYQEPEKETETKKEETTQTSDNGSTITGTQTVSAETNTTANVKSTAESVPQTGDVADIALPFTTAAVSLAGLVVLFLQEKKKEEEAC